MKYSILFVFLFLLISCQSQRSISWSPYDEAAELAENADHPSSRLRYKLLQSRVMDKNTLWKSITPQLKGFTASDYEQLKPLILDQDIFTMQKHVEEGKLSYEKLTQWYLYRISLFENDKEKYLNAIISINPDAVARARKLDETRTTSSHPIYGMPVLLKDNVNFAGIPTTAGAQVFQNNRTEDAFITKSIKEKGGIILGKTNLSEWANYLCLGCPNGYSAVGGQTLNAYGRKQFDTGGSSSGSGAAMAAGYAAAAVGTETSGSILSPSSQSSLVGLKPTIGVLSQDGIVPISSTLDTPGPMTRSVLDNAILLSAMKGKKGAETSNVGSPQVVNFWEVLKESSVKGLRLGVNKNYLEDGEYAAAIAKLRAAGAELFEFEPIDVDFDGFGNFLSADMAKDLPAYIKNFGDKSLKVANVADIVDYNLKDTLVRIPYGQGRFSGILDLDLSPEEYTTLKKRLHDEGKRFLEAPMREFKLDAILSINNYGAGAAAVAQYPCLTVPMGYTAEGEPKGLTFVGRPYTEGRLLEMGAAFERLNGGRVRPAGY
ncbi:amidase family protein [Neolewinella persica]|uniref:amidase family protein n=1 Tax=Neolewinella persica TaxID=70998 RepID=UPI00036E6BE2|nr:amidase family protein [Neolewinella persica]